MSHEIPMKAHEVPMKPPYNHHLTIMKPALSNGDSCHLHVSPSLWLSRIHLAQGPQVPMSASVQRHSTMLSSGMVDPCTDGMIFFYHCTYIFADKVMKHWPAHVFTSSWTDWLTRIGVVCVCVCFYMYVCIYIYMCVCVCAYTSCMLHTLYRLYRL